jgi:hypothetical protein
MGNILNIYTHTYMHACIHSTLRSVRFITFTSVQVTMMGWEGAIFLSPLSERVPNFSDPKLQDLERNAIHKKRIYNPEDSPY